MPVLHFFLLYFPVSRRNKRNKSANLISSFLCLYSNKNKIPKYMQPTLNSFFFYILVNRILHQRQDGYRIAFLCVEAPDIVLQIYFGKINTRMQYSVKIGQQNLMNFILVWFTQYFSVVSINQKTLHVQLIAYEARTPIVLIFLLSWIWMKIMFFVFIYRHGGKPTYVRINVKYVKILKSVGEASKEL